MSLEEIYNKIQKPDMELVFKIFNDTMKNNSYLYSELVRYNSKDKDTTKRIPENEQAEVDDMMLANIRKYFDEKDLNNCDERHIKYYAELKECFKNNNATSYEKFLENIEDEKLKEKIECYHKNRADTDLWNYYCDPLLKENSTYKIYINADYEIYAKLAKIYMEKCNNEKYHFKYSNNIAEDGLKPRDDGFVIYSTIENLERNLKILDEIKNENPELMEHIYEPPVLSGKYNYFGIAAEADRTSYNDYISNVLEKKYWYACIDKYVEKYKDENSGIRESAVNKMMENIKNDYKYNLIVSDYTKLDEEETKKIVKSFLDTTVNALNKKRESGEDYDLHSMGYLKCIMYDCSEVIPFDDFCDDDGLFGIPAKCFLEDEKHKDLDFFEEDEYDVRYKYENDDNEYVELKEDVYRRFLEDENCLYDKVKIFYDSSAIDDDIEANDYDYDLEEMDGDSCYRYYLRDILNPELLTSFSKEEGFDEIFKNRVITALNRDRDENNISLKKDSLEQFKEIDSRNKGRDEL